jgi:ABC-2 type transport system ATP-binding protein
MTTSSTSESPAVIEVSGLTRRYGRRIGIERLSFTVPRGSLFGFLGPNGSGKTTAIRVMMGLLKADEGAARIFGYECWRNSHRIKADLGYLPGDLRLYSWLSCRRAMRIFGRVRGCDLTRSGLELAEELELDGDLQVAAMSRGMRQKLGLILALAHHPQLLILDEPTSGLDPLMQERLFRRLRGMADEGHTVFFSSHTLSEVERLCDRVVILREGRLVAEEELAALKARAPRVVQIRWRTGAKAAALPPPPFLRVNQRKDHQWEATLVGDAMELVRWTAGMPVEDLSIGQPDLSRVFQRFYGDEEARP